ncbi:hypothetical protein TNCV_2872921 [Trichonephila clavipes]|nr:hypothetical protein TNCV_2872921 [Trichonephila clavipes]
MRICGRCIQDGLTDRRGQSQPAQCTTSREDKHIKHMAVKDRSVTSRTVAQHIEFASHHFLCLRVPFYTVYSRVITPPAATPEQLWQRVEAAFGLLYPKNISKVSLNQCRSVWQRLSPTMAATLATDSVQEPQFTEKIPEGSELANMVANVAKIVFKVAKLVTILVAKNYANLMLGQDLILGFLTPGFPQVLIESPL